MSGKDGACVIYENHVARVDLLKTHPAALIQNIAEDPALYQRYLL